MTTNEEFSNLHVKNSDTSFVSFTILSYARILEIIYQHTYFYIFVIRGYFDVEFQIIVNIHKIPIHKYLYKINVN